MTARIEHRDAVIVVWLAVIEDEATARTARWDRMPEDPSVHAVYELGSFRPGALLFERRGGWDVEHVAALLAQHGVEVGAESGARGDEPRGFEAPAHHQAAGRGSA